MTWLLFTVSAHAATLSVGPGRSYTTIGAAVGAARDGDVIAVDPGTYDEIVTVDGIDLTFSALGAVVWTGQDDSLLRIYRASVSILGFTFEPDGGRGVRVDDAEVDISGCTFQGNNGGDRAYNGAGVVFYNGSAGTISQSTFRDNHNDAAFFGGGIDGYGAHIHARDSQVDVLDSTFTDGSAVEGGAIHGIEDAHITVTRCTFADHGATERGGVFYLGEGSLTVSDSTFTNSTSDSLGGVLRWSSGFGEVMFIRNTFLASRADDFGGVIAANTTGNLQLLDNRFLDSSAGAGGAISLFQSGDVAAHGNLFCNSRSDDEGGAVRVNASGVGVWTNNIFVRSTSARQSGAALWMVDSDDHWVANNDVLDSSSGGPGGALWVSDTAAELVNNLYGWTQAGAAVAADGTPPSIRYSAWWDNRAGDVGAGLSRGAGPITSDPGLLQYVRNPQCSDDDLRLRPGSPLIDAGDPALNDPDGTRSDIGAYGGPDADEALFDDGDADGTVAAYDCDDTRSDVRPGAVERCDGLDNDCDGQIDQPSPPGAPTWYRDRDRDGYGDDGDAVAACAAPEGYVDLGGDCDDSDADVRPLVDERCDGVDNNCDGATDGPDSVDLLTWYADDDGDGFGTPSSAISACDMPAGHALADSDCDDTDAAVNPAAEERCNGKDDNCDLQTDGPDAVDPLTWYADGDGDGWGTDGPGTVRSCTAVPGLSRYDSDCDDGDPAVHPYAPEDCNAAVDANCDGSTGEADLDADGFRACDDCDDANPSVYPGAAETWYDGLIQDCNSRSDFDADRDGFDALDWGGDDCDDEDASVNPGATERVDDELDNDCDGEVGVDLSYDEDLKLGCGGCRHGQAAPGLLAALLGLTLRRRRR